MEIHINFVAVIVATVANFFVGFLWYTVLFGKAWSIELGIKMDVKPTGGQMAKGMILGVIGNFFMAWVFAHNIAAWSFVPGNHETPLVANILMSSVLTWLGFFVPVDLNGIAWERHSIKLFLINTMYHLICLVVAAVILIMM